MKQTAKTLCLFLCFVLLLSSGCAATPESPSHIDPGNTYGYYFDVFTSSLKELPRDGILRLNSYDDEMFFEIENSSSARQFAVIVFVDYKQVPIEVDGTEYDTFIEDAPAQLSKTYAFRLIDPIDEEQNHSLLVILVAGSDVLTSKVDYEMSQNYSIALEHALIFGDNYAIAQTTYGYDQTGPVTEYQSTGLLLNTDIENNSRKIPERELSVGAGEEFALQYQVGGYEDSNEVVVIIAIGLRQTAINGQDYIVCKTEDGALVYGTANLTAPTEPGDYEVMGWVITSPFSGDVSDYLPLDATYRFTLHVES